MNGYWIGSDEELRASLREDGSDHISSEFLQALLDAEPGVFLSDEELREPEERVDHQTGYLE